MTLLDELREACPQLREDEPLARHTSFAIGGPADYFADVNTLQELTALRRAVQPSLPVFFLGGGSNLLVSDRGIRGLVIHLQGDFRQMRFEGTQVTVGAGAWMPTLAKQAADHGLAGVEAMIGIPGTIGGGLVMNAGTRDGWLGHVVNQVDALDEKGDLCHLGSDDFGFGYRTSRLGQYWITGATLTLRAEDARTIKNKIDAILQYRTRTQPLATSNCGSVFKNPPEGPAAHFIEQAGLKGVCVGGARVSERHANFIINERHATAADVWQLMTRVQERVKEKFGIALEPEVKLVGEWNER